MPALHIHRDHSLGLERARQIAARWAKEAAERFDMVCTPEGDGLRFARSGVQGSLRVGADHFTLEARLGLLMGAFAGRIQAEIEANLDRLLAEEAQAARKPARAPRRKKPAA